MNKKFSTLVASLLLTSAFSVYSVDAKPMLATPTQVETRAAAADVEEAVEWNGTIPTDAQMTAVYGSTILPQFTNDQRLALATLTAYNNAGNHALVYSANWGATAQTMKYDQDTDADHSEFYWRLVDGQLKNNKGVTFTISGRSEYYEVIPVTKNNESTPYFVLGTRDNNGNLQYVYTSNTTQANNGVYGLGLTSNFNNAALFASQETAYSTPWNAATLNGSKAEGFDLFISSKIAPEGTTIVDENVFEGARLKAVGTSSYYQIMKGDNYIVFDTNEDVTSDGYATVGKFKTVKNVESGQWQYFQVSVADNGSNDIILRAYWTANGPQNSDPAYRLYIANAAGTYAVSVANENGGAKAEDWALVSLDGGNIVNPKTWLTGDFYTIDYKGNVVEADIEEYKKGGRLVVRNTGANGELQADLIDASTLYSKAPEAQWAVSASFNKDKEINGFILKNRENPTISVTITELRRVDNQPYYRVAAVSGTKGIAVGDFITMTPVAEYAPNDGYKVISTNDLKNKTYYLGQVRQMADGDMNIYWAENHAESHQIGATVEMENATRWNLSLVNKPVAAQTDSVLVDSWLCDWNEDKSRIDSVKTTLVILPYAFQNRSNNEFVKMNNQTNLDYYICDKDNKTAHAYGTDAIFALKRKADINGEAVYNYVALPARNAKTDYNKDKSVKHYDFASHEIIKSGNEDVVVKKSFANEKVYQENSTYYGTWKDMAMYAMDANSLMFVNEAQAPEYRKLVTTANLDTIRLFRADNEAQVVYEKKDPKSVVEGDTLSFLNIDNETQFTTINPALYADTAYVNRGNNTCWQYLLGVNIEHKEGYYCAEHGFNVTPPCEHAVPVSYNEGRYLVNLIDTANAYAANKGIHNNPYINESEEGRQLAKLGFVHGIHVLTDSVDMTKADHLYLIKGDAEGDTIPVALNTPAFNNVKFAFKYVDYMENTEEFKIQTSYKPYVDDTNAPAASEEGYLRWVNGCIVVDNGYTRGDVFNMDENETRTPTANETIESAADATISVVAVDGAVIVKGAEGKNVIVSTILGKVVANEVLNSDNETIAAPAGIVVVSVDGESFKVAVK